MPSGHHPPVLDQAGAHGSSGQSAVKTGFAPSAIPIKPSPGKLAAAPNPHSRPSLHRFSAGSFFGGFRTPALLPGIPLAPGRHPKPFPIPDPVALAPNGEVRPFFRTFSPRHRMIQPHPEQCIGRQLEKLPPFGPSAIIRRRRQTHGCPARRCSGPGSSAASMLAGPLSFGIWLTSRR